MTTCLKCKHKEPHFICNKCGGVIHTNQSTRNGALGLVHDICPDAMPAKQKVFVASHERIASDK